MSDGYLTDDILSQALDLFEEEEDYKVFLTQNRFSVITESQCDALQHAVDISDMCDDDGPCLVTAQRHSETESQRSVLQCAADDISQVCNDDGPCLVTEQRTSQTAVRPPAPAKHRCSENVGKMDLRHPKVVDSELPRFPLLTDETLRSKGQVNLPLNTERKNRWALNAFAKWRSELLELDGQQHPDDKPTQLTREVIRILKSNDDLLQYTDVELNLVLSYFVGVLRKEDGTEYKSDSIFSLIIAIQRHLNINGIPCSFFSNPCFTKLKNVVDNVMMEKCRMNVGGLKRNQAEVVSLQQENYLWDNGFLGDCNPSVLLNTIFWLVGLNFGLRGGQEHRDVCMDNFVVAKDTDGVKYVEYTESVSKTYKGGLKHRKIDPHTARAYENITEPQKCPVRLFEAYISRLPENRTTNAFYFQPLTKPHNQVWFSCQPVGHNKLEQTVKRIMSNAGIQGYFTNHSLRATTATRLYRAGMADQLIKEQTGHRSTAVEAYKRTSDKQKRTVSAALGAPLAKSPRRSNLPAKTPDTAAAEDRMSTSTSAGSDLPSIPAAVNCTYANITINFPSK